MLLHLPDHVERGRGSLPSHHLTPCSSNNDILGVKMHCSFGLDFPARKVRAYEHSRFMEREPDSLRGALPKVKL